MMQNTDALKSFFEADDKRLNFLEAILPIYISELNKSVAKLNTVHSENNAKEFSAVIHKMKGSAVTFGAKPIYSECLLIEDKCAQTENINSIDLNTLLTSVALLNEIYPNAQ